MPPRSDLSRGRGCGARFAHQLDRHAVQQQDVDARGSAASTSSSVYLDFDGEDQLRRLRPTALAMPLRGGIWFSLINIPSSSAIR